jgi:hypothetical protein
MDQSGGDDAAGQEACEEADSESRSSPVAWPPYTLSTHQAHAYWSTSGEGEPTSP